MPEDTVEEDYIDVGRQRDFLWGPSFGLAMLFTMQRDFSSSIAPRVEKALDCRSFIVFDKVLVLPRGWIYRLNSFRSSNCAVVLIRPTLLVTRHRRLRREEIGRMSRVPTKFEERDKIFSLRGGFNTTENGTILSWRDKFCVSSRVLQGFEEFSIPSRTSRVTWPEE